MNSHTIFIPQTDKAHVRLWHCLIFYRDSTDSGYLRFTPYRTTLYRQYHATLCWNTVKQQPCFKYRLDISALLGEMNRNAPQMGVNLVIEIASELINDFCLLLSSWIWLAVTERIRQLEEESRNSAKRLRQKEHHLSPSVSFCAAQWQLHNQTRPSSEICDSRYFFSPLL